MGTVVQGASGRRTLSLPRHQEGQQNRRLRHRPKRPKIRPGQDLIRRPEDPSQLDSLHA